MIFSNDFEQVEKKDFDGAYGGHTAVDFGDLYDPLYGARHIVLNCNDIANLLAGKVLVWGDGEYTTLVKFGEEISEENSVDYVIEAIKSLKQEVENE